VTSVHHIPDDGPILRSGADALGLLYDDGAADADEAELTRRLGG